MNNNKLIALAITLLIPCANAVADLEKSLSAELPTLTLAFELGAMTTPRDYLAATFFVGPEDVFGAGVNWTRSISANKAHWLGAGVGHMSDRGTNYIIDFNLGTYGSLDYKYFKNGLESSGFYFNTSFRFADEGYFPWLGFGYNF